MPPQDQLDYKPTIDPERIVTLKDTGIIEVMDAVDSTAHITLLIDGPEPTDAQYYDFDYL